MGSNRLTWFGFKISQKQSVQIFIGSIIGLFISLFFLLTMLTNFLIELTYIDPDPYYYYPRDEILREMVIGMIPFIFIFGLTFLLSFYSIIRCKIIARNYNSITDPIIASKPVFQKTEIRSHPVARFCPNCGRAQKGHEQFCIKCGNKLKS